MTTTSADSSIAEFIGRYTPEMARNIVASRKKLRAFFPRGYELVFDNYNALVFGIAPSDKTRESFLSIAAYPRWVTLFFLNGASLPDPDGLLEGAGKQVRGIKLKSPDDLDSPSVKELIAQACEPVACELRKAPPLKTVIKMVATKQRPRSPAGSAPKTSSTKRARAPQ